MSTQRFSPAFKEEAVKQVTERNYSVPEVAARLGVSAHSLYKGAKAVRPEVQTSKELLEAKGEILRLRAQMRRVEEDRDLLKKGRAVLCQRARVKYRFIKEHRHEFTFSLMRRVLRVATTGFYQWLYEPVSQRAIEDERPLCSQGLWLVNEADTGA